MIISDEHRYVFIEQPHTACTAIHTELIERYGGRSLLNRHATYPDFLRVATREQKRYYVFSGIRNPLDEMVSLYYKARTDHDGRYSRRFHLMPQRLRRAFAFVHDDGADFGSYLRRFYRLPYDNDTLIAHRKMNRIVRFEHLQEDFSTVLREIGLEQQRPLPVTNKTAKPGHFLDHYTPDIRHYAIRIFGPFMLKWGYPLPAEWGDSHVPRSSIVVFRVLGGVRFLTRRYLLRAGHPLARLSLAIVRPAHRAALRVVNR